MELRLSYFMTIAVVIKRVLCYKQLVTILVISSQ